MILVEMMRILMMRTRLTMPMHDVVCKQASSFSSKSQVRAHLLFADCISDRTDRNALNVVTILIKLR